MNPSRMTDTENIPKYKWTPESTSLLVSIWSDKQVQKQLEYATKPQLIWESMARYMRKKGYNVSAKHCRSRMKQVLVCYREAKKAGTRADVEQYYDLIDKVLISKRQEHNMDNGIDTVDASTNMKSPSKDIKTTKNIQMRQKFQEPVQSFLRTEALSPTWTISREYEYPDSPESNETIVARPYGVLSPTRDAAVNTCTEERSANVRRVPAPIEEPIREEYRQNVFSSYPYGDVPYQNSVQNVQNQIIQENMQQNQNFLQNHMWHQMQQQNILPNGLGFQNNINQERLSHLVNDVTPTAAFPFVNPNILRQHNQLHQIPMANNRAMPQEPQKINYGQNLVANTYRRYQETVPRPTMVDTKQCGSSSPDYSPDVTSNLNVAFCQSGNETKLHNLNETFNCSLQTNNSIRANPEVSVVTNNATCNDDSLLLDCLMDSPTPSENDNKSKDTAVNTVNVPNVPLRKKKAQKLEQLVLSAINSQNEVVNKILAAQNDMVSKFLDIDRDRQSRLENRLDHLLNVVHTTVINKNADAEQENKPSFEEPDIVSLDPPPKPGVVPPKLDLVPPKPCRVPCTMANSNIELVNKNPILTRPGVVSPITSPSKRPEAEKQIEEKIENARLQQKMGQNLNARRQLFTQREPTTEMILTAVFLEAERRMSDPYANRFNSVSSNKTHSKKLTGDNLLAGQGESYEYLRQLNQLNDPSCYVPCDTSTPAKITVHAKNSEETYKAVPKQTIQQLAQLVMNSARWRNIPSQNEQFIEQERQQNVHKNEYNTTFSAPKTNAPLASEINEEKQDVPRRFTSDLNEIRSTESLNERPNVYKSSLHTEPGLQKPVFPMGFTTTMLDKEIPRDKPKELIRDTKSIGFVDNMVDRKQQNATNEVPPLITSHGNVVNGYNQNMMERYIHEIVPKHQVGNKNKETDSDDDEFLDTTGSMPPVLKRRGSLTSTGTTSTEAAHSMKTNKLGSANCIIS
ncbi:hypothetical protein KPH14_002770 [Odynerus spinipes]|uniref:Myb/SANT-like DNA-binding domain-containing protein n=1 Tax=Odynerus spinipes TaxID=1348599 RepID=A0AAD9RMV4_9HYME|nr:hypothetical protein KPH14_002770 [Odynerus spinipes]